MGCTPQDSSASPGPHDQPIGPGLKDRRTATRAISIRCLVCLVLAASAPGEDPPAALTQAQFGHLLAQKLSGGSDPRFIDPPVRVADDHSLVWFAMLVKNVKDGQPLGGPTFMRVPQGAASDAALTYIGIEQLDGSRVAYTYVAKDGILVQVDRHTDARAEAAATIVVKGQDVLYRTADGTEIRRVTIPR